MFACILVHRSNVGVHAPVCVCGSGTWARAPAEVDMLKEYVYWQIPGCTHYICVYVSVHMYVLLYTLFVCFLCKIITFITHKKKKVNENLKINIKAQKPN